MSIAHAVEVFSKYGGAIRVSHLAQHHERGLLSWTRSPTELLSFRVEVAERSNSVS